MWLCSFRQKAHGNPCSTASVNFLMTLWQTGDSRGLKAERHYDEVHARYQYLHLYHQKEAAESAGTFQALFSW